MNIDCGTEYLKGHFLTLLVAHLQYLCMTLIKRKRTWWRGMRINYKNKRKFKPPKANCEIYPYQNFSIGNQIEFRLIFQMYRQCYMAIDLKKHKRIFRAFMSQFIFTIIFHFVNVANSVVKSEWKTFAAVIPLSQSVWSGCDLRFLSDFN